MAHNSTPPTAPANRIRSIDFLRGLVMVLMAIDHVRVYSGIPAGGQTAPVFFTRWITHFCVPAFVFFAGTSAFLYGEKINDRRSLSAYLFVRGMILVILELTIIRFCWTFNFDYAGFTLAGVIWMLGWCMMLMSVCVKLSPQINGLIGLLIILFQNVFSYTPAMLPDHWRGSVEWFWAFIYPTGQYDHAGITILYVVVPWIGVMMLGYSFGMIITTEQAKRKKWCLWIGSVAIVLFLIIGIVTQLLNPAQHKQPALYELLNQQKYPPSLLFLLMTLGPLIFLIPFVEKFKGKIADIFVMFGRVPLLYYLLHIPIIHLLALATNFLRESTFHQDWYVHAPFTEIPAEHRWGLPLLYLVFFVAEVVLFYFCRVYTKYKSSHPEVDWLKYL